MRFVKPVRSSLSGDRNSPATISTEFDAAMLNVWREVAHGMAARRIRMYKKWIAMPRGVNQSSANTAAIANAMNTCPLTESRVLQETPIRKPVCWLPCGSPPLCARPRFDFYTALCGNQYIACNGNLLDRRWTDGMREAAGGTVCRRRQCRQSEMPNIKQRLLPDSPGGLGTRSAWRHGSSLHGSRHVAHARGAFMPSGCPP